MMLSMIPRWFARRGPQAILLEQKAMAVHHLDAQTLATFQLSDVLADTGAETQLQNMDWLHDRRARPGCLCNLLHTDSMPFAITCVGTREEVINITRSSIN